MNSTASEKVQGFGLKLEMVKVCVMIVKADSYFSIGENPQKISVLQKFVIHNQTFRRRGNFDDEKTKFISVILFFNGSKLFPFRKSLK